MIKVKLLNSDAALNSFFELNSISYVPGENLTIALRVFDSQRDIRYVPPVAATMSLEFDNKDGTTLTKSAAVISSDDRSMWSVTLSQTETTDLAGTSIRVSLDVNGNTTVIFKAVAANVLSKTNLSGDC